MRTNGSPEVVVVGADPAGCVTALSFAREGARVLLVDSDEGAGPSERIGGEWLHPGALAILERLGIDLRFASPYPTGEGFVVYPCDGGDPIELPYPGGATGFALEHALLVETLRAHCRGHDRVEIEPGARATRVEGQTLTLERRSGATRTVTAPLIVNASGRARASFRDGSWASSRVASVVLDRARLPFEGFHHVLVGGPGPVTLHRIDGGRLRVSCDVPLSSAAARPGSTALALYEACASALPHELRAPFRAALRDRPPRWTTVELRPRVDFGREGLALVGEAAGAHHPMIATDLALALEDAATLARAPDVRAWARERARDVRVPEMLAVALYELFADEAEESIAMRRALYRLWREAPRERLRTMGFVSGADRSPLRFSHALAVALGRGTGAIAGHAVRTARLGHGARVAKALGARAAWLVAGTLDRTDVARRYGAALRASAPRDDVAGITSRIEARGDDDPSAEGTLRRAVRALVAEQRGDGSFEGEVVWCPMIAAQYVLAWHAMGRPIDPRRRARLLLHFERTRLEPSGGWGLHALSPPYLFVTTLVYVAGRLLGLAKDDPLLARARDFIRSEGGAAAIPTWGKLWLALIGLYEWEGVSPIVPELFRAPRWLPLHPSRWYCHTRLIYLAMAVLHAERWRAPATPRILALRDELFPEGYDRVDFRRAREALRAAEIHTPWSRPLRAAHRALAVLDRARGRSASRAALLRELRDEIRYELRSTSHTCVSPVSGLLSLLALHAEHPDDPDLAAGCAGIERWFWEDDVDGARIAGARSATWDTSFAVQALAAAPPSLRSETREALSRADAFLASQQILRGVGDEARHDRLDPTGGYCVAGAWHGWPVSDCTAEAILARLESPEATPRRDEIERAVEFVLRCRNSDGGFGSYEARRVDLPLEWLNPAEMFGDSMTERSYVECTASCVAALAAFARRFPESTSARRARAAAHDGVVALRGMQRPDGAWPGLWGVHLAYGTMFGVRGLLAGGVAPHDPQIRRACAFLKARQRGDGAWGEHWSSVRAGRWIDHDRGQVVQTAWAMTTLLEAGDPDFGSIARAARWLSSTQRPDGTWPQDDPAGIFFHTALLDYTLYRRYFPVWSLALYESRRAARASFREPTFAPLQVEA